MGLIDGFLRIKVVGEVFNLWVVEEGRSLEVNRVEVHNGGEFDGGGAVYVDGGVEGDEEIVV
jgi:hypothetical protein